MPFNLPFCRVRKNEKNVRFVLEKCTFRFRDYTILGILAFVVAIYFSIFHTTVACIEMENQIVQMLIENYNMFLESQNVVYQILGLL